MSRKEWCDRCGAEVPNDENYPKRTDGRFAVGISATLMDPDDEESEYPDLCTPCRLDIALNGETVPPKEKKP